jgi:hypothetical protein
MDDWSSVFSSTVVNDHHHGSSAQHAVGSADWNIDYYNNNQRSG